MTIKTVGIITYDFPHLKTEQVLQRILDRSFDYRLYALVYTPRTPRNTLFQHRPDQTDSIHPRIIAEKHELPYILCGKDTDIDAICDVYVILGAGVLSPECVRGKKIINCHPGIIPSSRGLDSFKWALHEMKPLGITLHYIDEKVDAGEIISVVPTRVYKTDSLSTLARRHYENEIDCLSCFDAHLNRPSNPFSNIAPGDARKRMPLHLEQELADRLGDYTAKFN